VPLCALGYALHHSIYIGLCFITAIIVGYFNLGITYAKAFYNISLALVLQAYTLD